jgi:peroxiredoxin
MIRRPVRPRRRGLGLGWRWAVLALGAAAAIAAAVVVILDYGTTVVRPAVVAVGDVAPTFVLESTRGERVDLASYVGRKPVILVFHGGYHCATCRAQLGKLRRERGRVRSVDAEVLAISDDSPIEANRLAGEVGHEIAILSDRTRWVGYRYGMRDPARWFLLTGYVVIDRDGRVRARQVDALFGEHASEIVKILEEAARPARR